MSALKLFLLGTLRLEVDDQMVEIQRRKVMALLVYLAVTGDPQRRDALAALFWPDYDQSQARTALTRHLSELRKISDQDFLVSNRETVTLAGDLWLDISRFQQLVAACAEPSLDCLDPLTEAVTLYHDDFLTGFTLPDCPDFDEWQFFQTEGLRQQLALALERLIIIHSHRGDYEVAIPYARRWLALDPLHELAHRQLIELYALTGQQAAALRQYQVCLDTLKAELGLPPSEEMTALYERVRQGAVSREAVKPGSQAETAPEQPAVSPSSPHESIVTRHNLPPQSTPFIGREAELAELDRLLKRTEGRLITIVGSGGMGKTRLALALAETQLTSEQFPNGVFFVSLAPLSEMAHIVPAIAEAMDFSLEAGGQISRTQRQQLLGYLRERALLLVLDNFEHLLDGVDLVAEILQAAPKVRTLATSRERLHLHQEQLFAIRGLEFPDWETPEEAAGYPAAKLFIESARRVQHTFRLETDDLTYLTRICRLVEGMPLGIELAAAWVDLLSLADIAAEIQRSLDFLETEARNVPNRQRSIRAVFDSAWGRLSEGEQSIFAQFSVFHGGFTRQAAQGVTGASLRLLSTLASKSLLQYDKTNDRYQIHELLRQYAAEKLEFAGQTEATRDIHAAYFAGFLQQQEPDLKGRREHQARSKIGADFENVRRGWLWAVERKDYASLEQALEGLYWFLNNDPHRFQEGQSLFDIGREALIPSENEAPHPVWGKILARILPYGSGHFADPAQDKIRLEYALTIAEANDDKAEMAFCRWLLGQVKDTLGEIEAAISDYEHSLTYYRQVDNRFYIAWTLKMLGTVYNDQKEQDHQAVHLLQQALQMFQELGISEYPVLSSLAGYLTIRGDFEQAEMYLQRAYDLSQARNNHHDLTGALIYMGVILFARKQTERARPLILEALAIAEENNLEWRQMQARQFLGMMANIQADYDQALHYLNLIQDRKPKIDWFARYTEIWLGLTVYGLGQYDLARQYLVSGLRDQIQLSESLSLAALLINQAGNPKRATSLLALAFNRENVGGGVFREYPLARRLRDELAAVLPPDVFVAAWEQGQLLDLGATFTQLAEEVSQPGWPDGLISTPD